jgi:hypothetical protein
MASVNDLTDFYYNELYPELKGLEEERKQLKSRVLTVFGLIALITVSIALLLTKNAGFSDIVFFILFAGFALGGVVYKLLIKDYTSGFKLKIIRPLIKAISNDLHYAPLYHVSETLFSHSRLFTQSVDRFRGNDHVKGDIDGIPFEFSDLHAEHKTKDSKGRTSWHTIFQGLFIVAEFNKHFKGNTVVVPDTAESTFGSLIGNWMQSNNYSRSDLIKMDDPSFEKEFAVYGTDQIEARYILTHAMMKRLMDLRKRAGEKIYVSFHGTHIYIAIDYRDDLFEPKLFSSLLDFKAAMAYIQTLHMATGIIKELKLNERLWSKH